MSEVDDYIHKQPSPQREVCRQLRGLIHETLPGISEGMKWGVPAFGNGMFYIVALKDHVNVGFSIDTLTREELLLFDGGGKTTRHIRVASLEELDRAKARIVRLLDLVWERQVEQQP